MSLANLDIYNSAMEIGEQIWTIASGWNKFVQNTIGYQIVRSADSIASNLAEGYGRYSYNENKQFCYYARGSLFETITWLKKAYQRTLLSEKEFNELTSSLEILSKRLNKYIKSIGQPSNHGKTRQI